MALFDRLNQYQPYALTVLRLMTGLQFIEHGLQKFFSFPPAAEGALSPDWQHYQQLPHLIFTQGLLESVGGLLIILGLLTRPVAFILCGNMAVAYFMSHFPKNFFPALNGGDAAILFCFVFMYLFFAGPGRLALDNLIFGDRRR